MDLYVVSSRYEGGPQAVIEAAAMKVPIISNDVGIASKVLDPECVFDINDKKYIPGTNVLENCKKLVSEISIKKIGKNYLNMFEECIHG